MLPAYETDIDLVPGVLPPAYGSGTPIPGQLMPAYGYPGGFDFTNPGIDFDSRITFTRASSATYFDAAGTLKTVTTNIPRANYYQDHNPSTLQNLGFLIEEARTNLALWCRDFTNAAWAATDITPVKTATGITGDANSASTLTATANNGTILQSITSASAARATSCFVKRRTGTGAIEMTQDNGGTWAAVTVTASWTRVTITSATVTDPVVGFRMAASGDAIDVDFFQIETGAFITSPILTTTASATRAADVATVASTNFTNLWNATEGSMLVRYSVPADATSKQILVAGDGTANERIIIEVLTARAGTNLRVVDGGVTQADVSRATAWTAGQLLKNAVAYKVNDFAITQSGGAVGTDTSGTIPTVTTLFLGDNGAGMKANVHIRDVTIYKQRLTDSQLQGVAL